MTQTIKNLTKAFIGESQARNRYTFYAKIAKKEGLAKIAVRLQAIAKAETHHEERYRKLLKVVQAKTVFRKDKKIWWVCRECGYIHYGKEAPSICPSCDHPQAFYQIKCERY